MVLTGSHPEIHSTDLQTGETKAIFNLTQDQQDNLVVRAQSGDNDRSWLFKHNLEKIGISVINV